MCYCMVSAFPYFIMCPINSMGWSPCVNSIPELSWSHDGLVPQLGSMTSFSVGQFQGLCQASEFCIVELSLRSSSGVP